MAVFPADDEVALFIDIQCFSRIGLGAAVNGYALSDDDGAPTAFGHEGSCRQIGIQSGDLIGDFRNQSIPGYRHALTTVASFAISACIQCVGSIIPDMIPSREEIELYKEATAD